MPCAVSQAECAQGMGDSENMNPQPRELHRPPEDLEADSFASALVLDRMRTVLLLLPKEGLPHPLNQAAQRFFDEGMVEGTFGLRQPLGKAARHSFRTGKQLRYYGPLRHDHATKSPHVLVTGEHVIAHQGETLFLEIAKATPAWDREQALIHEIDTDVLTGVASRRRFFQAGDRMFAEAQRYGHALAVVLLDLDRFKAINDAFGHPMGDHVLKQSCRVWQRTLRRSDLLGRLGGEEFAVLLPHATEKDALKTAERLRAGLRALRIVGQTVTVSIGVAHSTPDDATFEQVLDRADGALYAAKEAGRDRVHYLVR